MEKYNVKPFETFNFEKKKVIKQKGNLVFVKILFSDINIWDKILSEIFNKKIVVYNSNISKNKEYSNKYNEFKLKYKPTKFYINNILKQDKEFKIFNNPTQQVMYINHWLKLANN